jgi:hypothetical protein
MAVRRFVALGVLVLAGLAGLAGLADAHPATRRLAAHATTWSPVARPADVTITKLITFVVENHSLQQMRTSMPYLHRLATTYAYATNYTAVRHPSLPNYLAIASGSTHGVTDDAKPSRHPLRGQTVFDQALARGETATIYAEAMTSICQTTPSYPYAVKHNPWAYFVAERASCSRNDVPLASLETDIAEGTLPNAGMVIPDLVHDAHDADLGTADAWIKSQVQLIQTGPDWQSGRLAVVITADEDDRTSGNNVLTVVASRYQDRRVVTTALTHYSLTRLYESVLGVRYLGGAANAASMSAAFGIPTIGSRSARLP